MNCVTAVCLITIAQVASGPARTSGPDARCGGYCLFLALDAVGLAPRNYGELEAALGPPGTTGYSMAGLEAVARSFGAFTLAVETSAENLHNRSAVERFTCIAFMKLNHFILIYDIDGSTASIADPPNANTIPIDTLNMQWSRKALLISASPLAPESDFIPKSGYLEVIPAAVLLACAAALLALSMVGYSLRRMRAAKRPGIKPVCLIVVSSILTSSAGCDPSVGSKRPTTGGTPLSLVASPALHDLGDVPSSRPDETRILTTTLKNIGARPLSILSISKNCSCTDVEIQDETIPPGKETKLVATIRLGDGDEPRSSILTITTDDSVRPMIPVRFVWRSINPLQSSPSAANFGTIRPGRDVAQELKIQLRSIEFDDDCSILCKSTSPYIFADFKRNFVSTPTFPDDSPTSQRIGILTIALRGLPPKDSESQNNHVFFQIFKDAVELARLDIPVSWKIRPPIELIPNRVSFGLCRPGEARTKRFRIVSTDGSDFYPEPSVHPPASNQAYTLRIQTISSHEYVCEVTAKAPPTPGAWKSIVQITTDHPDAGILELPTSGVALPARD